MAEGLKAIRLSSQPAPFLLLKELIPARFGFYGHRKARLGHFPGIIPNNTSIVPASRLKKRNFKSLIMLGLLLKQQVEDPKRLSYMHRGSSFSPLEWKLFACRFMSLKLFGNI